MMEIKDLSVSLKEEKKEIIHSINLNINEGEIHLLNGENGSGKSTLVNAIMGNPDLQITKGTIKLNKNDYDNTIISLIDTEFISGNYIEVTRLDVTTRSILGIYLANQYPTEIPGVNLMNFLRLIYNQNRNSSDKLPIFKFKEFILQKAKLINYPIHLLERNLNEGFSGGEKKKTEILQLMILEPKYIMLDEIDSGLDRRAVVDVFTALKIYKDLNPKSSFIIISHYDRVKEFLKPDKIHEMSNGVIN